MSSLSGVLTAESLTQAFRSLSQRRRYGVFEVAGDGGQIEVLFQEGKIVGAVRTEESSKVMICRKLLRGKRLTSEAAKQAVSASATEEELEQYLVGKGHVSAEDFRLASQSCQMDVLYSLRKAAGNGFYNFSSKMVSVDRDKAISVPPMQFLLDLVELDAEEERFEERFRSLDSTDVVVKASGEMRDDLTYEEHLVWTSIEVADCLKDISDLTLLSEYKLREALLSLLDRRLIEVRRERNGSLASVGLSALEDDEDEQAPSWNGEPNGTAPRPVAARYASGGGGAMGMAAAESDAMSTIIDRAANLLQPAGAQEAEPDVELDEEEQFEEEVIEAPRAKSSVRRSGSAGPAAILREEQPLVLRESEDSEEAPGWDGSRLGDLNGALLGEPGMRAAAAAAVAAVLIVVAILLPEQIDEWFKALSFFTSAK